LFHSIVGALNVDDTEDLVTSVDEEEDSVNSVQWKRRGNHIAHVCLMEACIFNFVLFSCFVNTFLPSRTLNVHTGLVNYSWQQEVQVSRHLYRSPTGGPVTRSLSQTVFEDIFSDKKVTWTCFISRKRKSPNLTNLDKALILFIPTHLVFRLLFENSVHILELKVYNSFVL